MFSATKANIILPSRNVTKGGQQYVLIGQYGYLDDCQYGTAPAIWSQILSSAHIARATSCENAAARWYALLRTINPQGIAMGFSIRIERSIVSSEVWKNQRRAGGPSTHHTHPEAPTPPPPPVSPVPAQCRRRSTAGAAGSTPAPAPPRGGAGDNPRGDGLAGVALAASLFLSAPTCSAPGDSAMDLAVAFAASATRCPHRPNPTPCLTGNARGDRLASSH